MSIILKDISKVYNKKTDTEFFALKSINLTIEKNEMVAIKGKSGAGKSTLLHIIGCLDEFSSGNYLVDDVSVATLKNKELAVLRNKKFGFVLQDFGLINDSYVISNVELPLMFTKTPMEEIRKKAASKLKAMNISHLANRSTHTLSGGEKQRVAIARALVNVPDYIIADEPTGSLDSANSEGIMQILTKLNELGKTIIIVTHDDKVANMCKRIITIHDGEICEDKNVD